MTIKNFRLAITGATLIAMSGAALADVPCRTSGPFESWLADVKKESRAKGISAKAIAAAEPYMTYEPKIINTDRGQRVFTLTFIAFAERIIPPSRLAAGENAIKTYAKTFARAEKEYGIPPAVISAFWGLESDYGSNMGNDHSIRSITTL